MSWEIDEFPRYERGPFWYMFMLLFGGGLLIYAIVTANFLFALIVLMLALVIYLSSVREPSRIEFAITDLGVKIGRTFLPYKDIRRFWFIYEPPEVKNLHLDFKSPFRPRIAIDLEDQNPNEIRGILAHFVFEDFEEDEEHFSDYIGRILKI
ncbi:hypothetical protein AMJ57_05455 [Parcubacteria bacterium SG8_24]|nr:MAG: hypothetical protein AMJ57_05455 [Parcubacteria bacterium SG8_24]